MRNNKVTLVALKDEAQEIYKLIMSTDITSSNISLIKIFEDIQVLLVDSNCDSTKIAPYSYAIFRVVTDDSELERSELGQNILHYGIKLEKAFNL